ncbi:hypothetical protein PPYR_11601 [Photinus pyralis]|uniref:SAM domain-containing protein n=1 Tax=Photinus pyralis TaxID=7054 RepID=A0A5N4ABS9_PHOPY|nr:hypothetical protein PPYR_11601 [Photinus pyralis]
MDQLVTNLLTNWGFFQYIDVFAENRIDTTALTLLTEGDVANLVPVLGDRVKLLAQLTLWKADNECSNINRLSTEKISIEGSGTDPGSPQSFLTNISSFIRDNFVESPLQQAAAGSLEEQNLLSPQHEIPPTHPTPPTPILEQDDAAHVRNVLLSSLQGRIILSSEAAKTGLLHQRQRKEIVKLLINHEFERNPQVHITFARFQTLARGIAQLFNCESPVLYYTAYISAQQGKPKRNPSGSLYNYYLRQRRNLISKQAVEPFRKRKGTSSSTTSENSGTENRKEAPIDLSTLGAGESERVEESILFCQTAVEGATPWEEVERHWGCTTRARLAKLYHNPGNLHDYIEEFPILKGPSGYRLLALDYQRIFPDKDEALLRESLESVSTKILQKAATKCTTTKDEFLKENIQTCLSSVDEVNIESKLNTSLLLLPYIFNTGTTTKKKGIKVSRAEVRANFILHVSNIADLDATLEDKRRQLESWNLTFQPLVVVVGESLSSLVECLVIVERRLIIHLKLYMPLLQNIPL